MFQPRSAWISCFLIVHSTSACTPRPTNRIAPVSDRKDVAALQRAQLDTATIVAEGLADRVAALRAGFHRIAPRAANDLRPFMGEHWINERNLGVRFLDLQRPAYLMFYPLAGSDELTLVGTAYGTVQPAGEPVPNGFAGSNDRWHTHVPCANVPGLDALLAENTPHCLALGGKPGATHIAMVHVWVNKDNPLGPFAHDNPALPYVAVGLTPPTAENMANPERARWLRALGLALSETYGAVPRLSSRLELHPDSTFAQTVAPMRERIKRLLPRVRTADSDGNATEFERLGNRAIAEWQHIREAYLDAALARSPELRSLFQRWFEAALDPMHGSKMD